MLDFPAHTIDTAPDAAKPLMEGATKAYSFLPNLYGDAVWQARRTGNCGWRCQSG